MNMRFLSQRTDELFAVVRIASGLMFSVHGMQKIFGILGAAQPAFGTQMWLGGLIELAGGLAVALGFFTSWAAFLCSGTMATAYTQFHWKLAFGKEILPVVNKGELALLYAFVFLLIAAKGSGKFSVDRWRKSAAGGAAKGSEQMHQ